MILLVPTDGVIYKQDQREIKELRTKLVFQNKNNKSLEVVKQKES